MSVMDSDNMSEFEKGYMARVNEEHCIPSAFAAVMRVMYQGENKDELFGSKDFKDGASWAILMSTSLHVCDRCIALRDECRAQGVTIFGDKK